jgi:hypothetical protein
MFDPRLDNAAELDRFDVSYIVHKFHHPTKQSMHSFENFAATASCSHDRQSWPDCFASTGARAVNWIITRCFQTTNIYCLPSVLS